MGGLIVAVALGALLRHLVGMLCWRCRQVAAGGERVTVGQWKQMLAVRRERSRA